MKLVNLLLASGFWLLASAGAQEVYFSPDGGCTVAIVREINAATNLVLVQGYSFTSEPISAALAQARKRKVHVYVILDGGQLNDARSEGRFLEAANVSVAYDKAHAIAHNKIIIVDRRTVITGSFNFSKAAERSNAENVLILRDTKLADKYSVNWQLHSAHSKVRAKADGQRPEVRSPKAKQ